MSTDDYLNHLLQSVHDTYPNIMDSEVLRTVFSSIFLALVVQNTNVILSTPHVGDLQRSTAKVLSSVFGLQTKRVKIRSPESPHDLLLSLFLSPSSVSSSPASHKRKLARSSFSRSHSAPRPPSSHFTEGSDSTAPAPPPSSSRLPRHKTDPLLRDPDIPVTLHLPQAVVISGLEHAGRAAQLALAEVLRTRRVVLESPNRNGITWNLPDHFCVFYISPIGDSRERPAIHNTLLDYFAFGVTSTRPPLPIPAATSSPRLRQIPLTPPKTIPLLPYDRLPRPATSNLPPIIRNYISALITAARHHPELDGTLLTAHCVKDAEKLVHASNTIFRQDEEQSMITEVHVRRVVPLVLTHRLRVRNSPREQIMGILWEGAGVRRWGETVDEKGRRAVPVILSEILQQI